MTKVGSRDSFLETERFNEMRDAQSKHLSPPDGSASGSCELLITAHKCRLGAQLQVT